MKQKITKEQFGKLLDKGIFYKSSNGNEYVPKTIGKLIEWIKNNNNGYVVHIQTALGMRGHEFEWQAKTGLHCKIIAASNELIDALCELALNIKEVEG